VRYANRKLRILQRMHTDSVRALLIRDEHTLTLEL
jgi:hypothetical protein